MASEFRRCFYLTFLKYWIILEHAPQRDGRTFELGSAHPNYICNEGIFIENIENKYFYPRQISDLVYPLKAIHTYRRLRARFRSPLHDAMILTSRSVFITQSMRKFPVAAGEFPCRSIWVNNQDPRVIYIFRTVPLDFPVKLFFNLASGAEAT